MATPAACAGTHSAAIAASSMGPVARRSRAMKSTLALMTSSLPSLNDDHQADASRALHRPAPPDRSGA